GQVGIKANVLIHEWGSYSQKFTTHNVEPMYMLGWSLPSLDPDHWATPLLGENEPVSNFDNDEIHALIKKARSEMDPDARMNIYKELNDLVHKEAPWLFLMQFEDI